MIATVCATVLAFYVAKRYVFKETFYGKTADDEFLKLELDIKLIKEKPYDGWRSRQFPSLIIEKKWGKPSKVIYYTFKGENKIEKTWCKKGIDS